MGVNVYDPLTILVPRVRATCDLEGLKEIIQFLDVCLVSLIILSPRSVRLEVYDCVLERYMWIFRAETLFLEEWLRI